MKLKKKLQTITKVLINMQGVSAGFVLLFSCLVFFVNDIYDFKKHTEIESESVARIICRNIAASLEFDDKEEGQKVLSSLEGSHIIESAIIFDKDKKIFITQGYFKKGEDKFPLSNESSFIKRYHLKEIKEKDTLLGYIFLKFNKNYFTDTLLFYLMIFLLTIIISSILGYILAYYMQRKISKPLEELIDTFSDIKKDDFSVEREFTPALIGNIEEFNILYEDFDEMLKGIMNRQEIINLTNKNLEKIVEDRTHELDQERAKNIHDSKLKALGVLAGGVAHEINNPLTIISLQAYVLKGLLNKNNIKDEKFYYACEQISSTVTRISDIIKSLKNISRDSSLDQIELVVIDKLIEEVINLAKINFNLSDIDIKHNTSLTDGRVIYCRPGQIQQVILNLINNAIDEVVGKENSWVKIDVREVNEQLEIVIADSGEGVSPENKEKIFDPFFTTKDIGKGTGLGLSISKNIVQQHGGDLVVGDGPESCFILTLPFHAKISDSEQS